jgi:hypothetical protein
MTFSAQLACLLLVPTAGLPDGADKLTLNAGEKDLTVFTYKAKDYKDGPLVLVFHGTLRNAEEYRDWAKVIADRTGGIVAAPLFAARDFPVNAYQMGGLMRKGKQQPEADWTWSLVPKIADELRQREGRKDMPYYLIGHSAGGQFLIRMAGFVKTEAVRIIPSNPGTLLFPTEEFPFPYGFGELPDTLRGEAALKKYLSQPVTLYLGTGDTIQDKYFPKGPLASKQGESRYVRGKNAFKAAEKLAKDKKWDFKWKLIEAEGVGHVAAEMFKNNKCLDALGIKGTRQD